MGPTSKKKIKEDKTKASNEEKWESSVRIRRREFFFLNFSLSFFLRFPSF